jgi:hypothetical protein
VPGGVQEAAYREHANGAEAVGDRAGERLTDAPQQVLERKGERKNIAAPAVLRRHRIEEQTGGRTRTVPQQRDQAATDENDGGRAPP